MSTVNNLFLLNENTGNPARLTRGIHECNDHDYNSTNLCPRLIESKKGMQNTMNLLNNWAFWAVVVATISVLLSQMPPIHQILKGAKLDLEIHNRISITHKIGNPNLQIYLLLSNVGGKRVKVIGINAVISRNESHKIVLPAQNFYPKKIDQDAVIFTRFNLDPKEEWEHTTIFLKYFDRDEEKAYLKMENDLRADYKIHKEKSKISDDNLEMYEHPKKLVAPVFEFYEQKYFWKAGEYTMSINVITDNPSTNITKIYRFTVFESHEEMLNSVKDYYKYGGGLYWNPNINTSVSIEVTEN